MDSKAVADKPHAVCIPGPFQSHIKAMFNLAKLLHHKGFHITFVNTDFNHKRLLKARGSDALNGLPDFRFESIPDGLPTSDESAAQDIGMVCESIRNYLLAPFLGLLAKLNRSSSIPTVTCIVSDWICSFTASAAKEFGIPSLFLITISACSFMGFSQFRALKEKGLVPLKDDSYLMNGYLDTIIDWIPGIKVIRLRDLPSYVRTTDLNDVRFNFRMEISERANEASAIIVHTFEALEREVLDGLSTIFPAIYAVGPLQLLLNQMHDDSNLNSIGWNLLKDEPECLEWLNNKEPNSVIYVNFGSIAVKSKEQLVEFAMGLANSNHYFLWIIRPDQMRGDSEIFPPVFKEKTRERGFIASWCAQEGVLNHPSVGGFLTHCGWNSILESLSAGVPMLCSPIFSDQPTNCRFACVEWGVGMEISSDAKKDEVEKLVRELMEGEKGKQLKCNVMEWKRMAEEATSPIGSSFVNFDKVVKEVLLSKCPK
ncbi:7-deoxyloganetin glucosyltransferase-like [Tripterygium wilfordii]|uniref:7-deoxyloganetin glucosyltransferase-like n=1 Tax=Tripterygium wilfordii TaxID=458696 RepID=UPI0018F82751|nr:7-deoxyloganetin glucosyltransferase-like [Tripterygium wilfordii]